MSENPYEAPKTIQTPARKRLEFIDRMGGYLRWSFRIGLLLVIATIYVNTNTDGAIDRSLDNLTIIGSILVIASILGIILLSIWGFIKGFQEGRGSGS